MRRSMFALLALPAALVAQEAAPAETLTQRYKAVEAAANKALGERKAQEALAALEAFIPAQRPAFNKATPAQAQASTADYSTLMGAHSVAGKAALMAGDWEKSLAHFLEAEAVAQENAKETESTFTAVIENWQKAVDDGKKALAEGAARKGELKAKATLDDREKAELENFKVHENNVRSGPVIIAKIKGSIDGLKSDAEGFKKVIDGVKKSLDEEKGNLTKFKNDKAKYVAAVFNPQNMALRQNAAEKMDFLARLMVLDPKNAKVSREMDKLMGRPVAPEPKAKGGKKKGK